MSQEEEEISLFNDQSLLLVLECPVCREIPETPKNLTCGHSICRNCELLCYHYDDANKCIKIFCPYDRSETRVDEDLVVIGDCNSGKSSLLNRYIDNDFRPTVSTIGQDARTKRLQIDKKLLDVTIWDTCGEERYRTLFPQFFRNIDGALLVYDTSNLASFLNVEFWLKQIYEHVDRSERDVNLILIGTKIDLAQTRQVSRAVAADFATSHGMSFYETSAKENENIKAAFRTIMTEVYGDLLKHGRIGPNMNSSNDIIRLKEACDSQLHGDGSWCNC